MVPMCLHGHNICGRLELLQAVVAECWRAVGTGGCLGVHHKQEARGPEQLSASSQHNARKKSFVFRENQAPFPIPELLLAPVSLCAELQLLQMEGSIVEMGDGAQRALLFPWTPELAQFLSHALECGDGFRLRCCFAAPSSDFPPGLWF